jgi:alkyl hydroperoxide reductase subunit AhpC
VGKAFKPGCARPQPKVKNVPEQTVDVSVDLKEEKKSMIKVGRLVPNFELSGYHKGEFKQFSLDEFKGKWVLLCFYPGDFTFVWATEVSAVADEYSELQALGAEVLSVSVDSVFVHKMWDDHELSKMVDGGIPFPMLSDQGGVVGEMYGVYDADAGVEMRGRFIIDPDGVLQGFEVLTPPVGRNVSETARQLQAFQLVRESQGTEATPSGWKPGKKTLKPGPELVGNVWKEWKVTDAK